VFGTLHTTGAVQTIDRIVDVFPTNQQEQIRVQLAATLQGVISQILLPKVEGGRVAAHEIMVGTDALRACIREGKSSQMQNILVTGSRQGMVLMDASLTNLVRKGQVEAMHAIAKAQNPDLMKKSLPGGRAPAAV
jgi:twitching motility protein PilT